MAVVIGKGAAAGLHMTSGEGAIHGPWRHLGVAGSSLLLLGGGIGGLERRHRRGADLGGMVYLKWKPEWSGGFGLGFNLLVGAHLLLWL